MEQIVQERLYPEVKRFTPPLKVSPLFVFVSILLAGSTIVAMSMRTVAQYNVPPLNPFPAYADIFPGRLRSAVEARGFSCQTRSSYGAPTQENTDIYCTFAPAIGDFLMIQVIISKGIIHQTDFLLRDNALQVGELEMLVGTTHFKAKPYGVVFSWRGSVGIASTLSGKRCSSLFRPVWRITFMDT